MKQMIVMVCSIALGIFIYGLVAGAGEGSIISQMSILWAQGLDARSLYGC